MLGVAITASDDSQLILSYLTLRRAVGILAVFLPVMLPLGVWMFGSSAILQNSISHYHGTVMRSVFVGVLFAIGVFLFSYIGYERADNFAGDIACGLALSVALFPRSGNSFVACVHFLSAAALFLVLAYFSIRLFTKDGGTRTLQKDRRNKIYIACGVVILLSIGLVPLYHLLPEDNSIAAIKPVFWLESIALWAFGFSWFIKGETLFKDDLPDARS